MALANDQMYMKKWMERYVKPILQNFESQLTQNLPSFSSKNMEMLQLTFSFLSKDAPNALIGQIVYTTNQRAEGRWIYRYWQLYSGYEETRCLYDSSCEPAGL